ncbi:MAG TPA: serine hydrolase [Longimicrobiaceae bacterium]|nr:serine hydrolase [Longimicrobiaceae bacterium]
MKPAALPLLLALAACAPTAPAVAPPAPDAPGVSPRLAPLAAEIGRIVAGLPGDTLEVSVALLDLERGDSLLVNARERMHAASTMKVPVMLELFRRADAGELSLEDSVPVRNEFRSIADGSGYALSADDDSEREIYARLGQRMTVRELIGRMIARSSNLATNLLIDLADPARIAATLAELGASETVVLRGVEDGPAYRAGMNNTTTAYGLMKTLQGIAAGRSASPRATEEMLAILERQEFREMIPAGLPPGVRVANKTGWITGIEHDAAIVLPEGRRPYVLVVLTRGFRDREAARRVAREVSREAYRTVVGR